MTARRLAYLGGLKLREASTLTCRGLGACSSNALLGFGRPVLAQHPRARLPPPRRLCEPRCAAGLIGCGAFVASAVVLNELDELSPPAPPNAVLTNALMACCTDTAWSI